MQIARACWPATRSPADALLGASAGDRGSPTTWGVACMRAQTVPPWLAHAGAPLCVAAEAIGRLRSATWLRSPLVCIVHHAPCTNWQGARRAHKTDSAQSRVIRQLAAPPRTPSVAAAVFPSLPHTTNHPALSHFTFAAPFPLLHNGFCCCLCGLGLRLRSPCQRHMHHWPPCSACRLAAHVL